MNTDLMKNEENGILVPEATNVSAAAREQHEIQSAIVMARRYPRNEQSCFVRAADAFRRFSMADAAQFSFPRGKKKNEQTGQWEDNLITGPSIYAARELARIWTNCRYGIRIAGMGDLAHIKGWAWDLEANIQVEMEDKFKPLVQRKDKRSGETAWITADERDLRELINRRGAIAVRNALLQILPADYVEDSIAIANDTLLKKAKNELKEDIGTTVKRLTLGFAKLGVSVEMIETKLGHKLTLITAEELIELTRIINGIKEGHTKREEHFEFEGQEAPEAKAVNRKAQEVQDMLNKGKEATLA